MIVLNCIDLLEQDYAFSLMAFQSYYTFKSLLMSIPGNKY